jgi:hypothetical protein
MSKDSLTAGQSSGNLNFKTAQKMIHRLLTEERIKTSLDDGIIKGNALPPELEVRVKAYTKKELADKLSISVEDINKLNLQSFYEGIVNKISLPLVTLYYVLPNL